MEIEHLNVERELNSVVEIILWIYYTVAEKCSTDTSAMCLKVPYPK